MTQRHYRKMRRVVFVLLATSYIFTTGCASGSQAAKGATQGATTGAVAGAVGGMMTALIFGGDVAEAGARGAVYGGATGAVAGGMAGSRADQAAAEQQQAARDKEIEEFRNSVGTDAFNGVVALAECKYEIALANARQAAASGNPDHSLAGIWLEVLIEGDRHNQSATAALFPELVSRDREIGSEAEAETRMNETLQEIDVIRAEYDLPVDCPA